MRKGKIIPNGVVLEKHEYKTVLFLTEQGFDIELIPKSNKKGIKTPDFMMNGEKWEMKSPKGEGRWLVENTLNKAIKQSPNIVLDLRRIQIHQTKCMAEVEKQFQKKKTIKKIKVITKNQKIVDFIK